MPPVTSPSTQARAALKAILQATFAVEGYPVVDDYLHPSVGSDGTKIGTSPVREIPRPGNGVAQDTEILVQFYGRWKKDIDNQQKVDPSKIEGYAERFRRALENGDPHTPYVWYFNLVEIAYPGDPTGNKTRFEARVVAVGQNSAIVETSG